MLRNRRTPTPRASTSQRAFNGLLTITDSQAAYWHAHLTLTEPLSTSAHNSFCIKACWNFLLANIFSGSKRLLPLRGWKYRCDRHQVSPITWKALIIAWTFLVSFISSKKENVVGMLHQAWQASRTCVGHRSFGASSPWPCLPIGRAHSIASNDIEQDESIHIRHGLPHPPLSVSPNLLNGQNLWHTHRQPSQHHFCWAEPTICEPPQPTYLFRRHTRNYWSIYRLLCRFNWSRTALRCLSSAMQ